MKRKSESSEQNQQVQQKIGTVGIKEYNFELVFTENVLASSPANPAVYQEYIESKAVKRVDPVNTAEESQKLDNADPGKLERTGWSVFNKDDDGLFLYEYHVKGFLKESARAVIAKSITSVVSKIDKWIFVQPRRLYFMRDGARIAKPDAVEERPLRAQTMQGPRVTLKRSDYVNAGVKVSGSLVVLPLGQHELTEDVLRTIFDYGKWAGISEWRNAGYGRFSYVLSNGIVA